MMGCNSAVDQAYANEARALSSAQRLREQFKDLLSEEKHSFRRTGAPNETLSARMRATARELDEAEKALKIARATRVETYRIWKAK